MSSMFIEFQGMLPFPAGSKIHPLLRSLSYSPWVATKETTQECFVLGTLSQVSDAPVDGIFRSMEPVALPVPDMMVDSPLQFPLIEEDMLQLSSLELALLKTGFGLKALENDVVFDLLSQHDLLPALGVPDFKPFQYLCPVQLALRTKCVFKSFTSARGGVVLNSQLEELWIPYHTWSESFVETLVSATDKLQVGVKVYYMLSLFDVALLTITPYSVDTHTVAMDKLPVFVQNQLFVL